MVENWRGHCEWGRYLVKPSDHTFVWGRGVVVSNRWRKLTGISRWLGKHFISFRNFFDKYDYTLGLHALAPYFFHIPVCFLETRVSSWLSRYVLNLLGLGIVWNCSVSYICICVCACILRDKLYLIVGSWWKQGNYEAVKGEIIIMMSMEQPSIRATVK